MNKKIIAKNGLEMINKKIRRGRNFGKYREYIRSAHSLNISYMDNEINDKNNRFNQLINVRGGRSGLCGWWENNK